MKETAAVMVPQLPDFTPAQLAKLAREIVMRIREVHEILPRFGISAEQYGRLAEHPSYKRILDAISIDWNCATNTDARIKLCAAAILEDNLQLLGARMGTPSEPLREVIEAGKLFSRLAGMSSEGEARGGGDGKFVINIDLGADAKLRFEKEVGKPDKKGKSEPRESPTLDLEAGITFDNA